MSLPWYSFFELRGYPVWEHRLARAERRNVAHARTGTPSVQMAPAPLIAVVRGAIALECSPDPVDVWTVVSTLLNAIPPGQPCKTKILKLLYLSSSLFAALTDGGELCSCTIEAWNYGPVATEVFRGWDDHYKALRQGGAKAAEELQKCPFRALAVAATLRMFGDKTAAFLVHLTHEPGTPWSILHSADFYSPVIGLDLMTNHASSNEQVGHVLFHRPPSIFLTSFCFFCPFFVFPFVHCCWKGPALAARSVLGAAARKGLGRVGCCTAGCRSA